MLSVVTLAARILQRLQDFFVASRNTPAIVVVRNGWVSWFRSHLSLTPACYDFHVIALHRVMHPSLSTSCNSAKVIIARPAKNTLKRQFIDHSQFRKVFRRFKWFLPNLRYSVLRKIPRNNHEEKNGLIPKTTSHVASVCQCLKTCLREREVEKP